MTAKFVVFLAAIAAASAIPAAIDPIIAKLDPEGLRYGYIRDDDGNAHLVDSWVKISDLQASARYNPDTDNEYHLYTRANPLVSQPIVPSNPDSVARSNFNADRKTIVLVHGFLGNILSGFNTVLVPAFLLAGDVNIIIVDWGAGATFGLNGISSGRSVSRFISWLNSLTGASLADYHIVGYSVGAHQAGIIGSSLQGQVGYISSLDAADRWLSSQAVKASDALYVEAIHTNAGDIGIERAYGHVDIYPNGGVGMPGCSTSLCDHYRSYFYLGESLATGGFTAVQCANLQQALTGTCNGAGRVQLGGLNPKYGSSGIYHLDTNASPPFSRG